MRLGELRGATAAAVKRDLCSELSTAFMVTCVFQMQNLEGYNEQYTL